MRPRDVAQIIAQIMLAVVITIGVFECTGPPDPPCLESK
jgi:hypothetical protein